MTWILCFFIRLYQLILSPLMPARCRYFPTCSSYALEALGRFGFFRGSVMVMGRLLRCHPWAQGGYDPVLWEEKDKK